MVTNLWSFNSIGNLACGLRVTPANVTGIVDRLVEQGLVVRTSDPDDRRIQLLKVTDSGEALLSNLREGRASHMRQILERLTSDELQILARGLDSLVNAAEVD